MFHLCHCQLRNVAMGPAIVGYLQRIDATLQPFGGKFVVHGGPYEVLEGNWSGDVVIIEFPDRERARGWYGSPAYREILPLSTNNSDGDAILIDTVPEDHRATDALAV